MSLLGLALFCFFLTAGSALCKEDDKEKHSIEFEDVWDVCQELLQEDSLDETWYKNFVEIDLEDIWNVLQEENICSEDTNNDENRIKYMGKIQDDIDNINKEGLVFLIIILLVAFPKVFIAIIYFITGKITNLKNMLNISLKGVKNNYAENRNGDNAERKDKQKKKVNKKSKKAAKTLENKSKVTVKKNSELQVKEESEVIVEKTDEVTTYLQKFSSTVKVFPSSSTQCLNCKKRGREDDPLKKCKGCRLVWYCREECQAQDWSCHKEFCKKENMRRQERRKEQHENSMPNQQEGQREDTGKTKVINMMELD